MPDVTRPLFFPLRAIGLALCLLLSLPPAQADPYVEDIESGPGQFNYDESRKTPWIEDETEVPDLPELETLQPLRITGLPPELKLFLDTARVNVNNKDGIVRLWVYLRSDRGADNGTYEGYRCVTGEYKVYAYATPRRDPPVTPARRSVWRKARDAVSTPYRQFLMSDYLCGLRGVRPPIEIQQAVRAGKPRDPLLYR